MPSSSGSLLLRRGGLLATRRGALVVATAAAALAAIAILVYLQQYRRDTAGAATTTTVLVAERLIQQGASADAAGAQLLYGPRTVARDDLVPGAITDASALTGQVAAHDVLPGKQLTRADFTRGSNDAVAQLGAAERAVAVPLDDAHGLIGAVKPGSRVDVLAGFLADTGAARPRPLLRTLLQDVLVLKITKSAGTGGQTSQVLLRIPSESAAKVAFSADNGKVWLVLRPQNGAPIARPSLVSLESLLFGASPLPARQPRRTR